MVKNKEANILIVSNVLREIITIFLGPFLTAYFFKISKNSLIDLSVYNILVFLYVGFFGLILGYIIKNKFQIGMFRIGVILNSVYVLTIIILKEQILNYLPLISFLYGTSMITYFYPYNLFLSDKVSNDIRTQYEFKRKTIVTIVGILTPIILGTIITTTNFVLTAIIILIISFIQIVISFFIKPTTYKNVKFTPFRSLKKLSKNKDIKNTIKLDIFKGMSIADGALKVLITLLIINAFKTDLNLGIFSSISSLLTIIFQYIYTKYYKNRNDKNMIVICAIIPVVSLIMLLILNNNIALCLYYFCYSSLVGVLNFIIDIRLFNLSNIPLIKKDNQMEFWSLREIALNLGRIISHILLLLVSIIESGKYLNILMLFLTLSIMLMGIFLSKTDKNDK